MKSKKGYVLRARSAADVVKWYEQCSAIASKHSAAAGAGSIPAAVRGAGYEDEDEDEVYDEASEVLEGSSVEEEVEPATAVTQHSATEKEAISSGIPPSGAEHAIAKQHFEADDDVPPSPDASTSTVDLTAGNTSTSAAETHASPTSDHVEELPAYHGASAANGFPQEKKSSLGGMMNKILRK